MNSAKQNKSRRKFLLKSAGYYFSILLLPVFIGYITYYVGVSIVRRNIYSVHEAMLIQGINAVEYDLQTMEKLALQVVSNPVLIKQAYSTSTGVALAFEHAKCINELKSYMVHGDNLENSYVYYHNNSSIINPSTMYGSKLFYDCVLLYDKNKYSDWHDLITARNFPKKRILPELFSKNKDLSYLTFAASLPMDVTREPRATFVTHLNKKHLMDKFKGVNNSGANFAIVDADGNIMLSSSGYSLDGVNPLSIIDSENGLDSVKLHYKNNLCIVKSSEYNEWMYIYLLPEKIAFTDLNTYRTVFISVFGLVMIVGIVAILSLLYRSNKPVYEIYRKLQITFDGEISFGNKTNAYTIIEQSINQLVKSNDALINSMREQAPVLKTAFTISLLRGIIYSEQEVLAQMEYLGVLPQFQNGSFFVALLRITAHDIISTDDMTAIELARQRLSLLAQENLQHVFLLHNLDFATIAVVFNVLSEENNVKAITKLDFELLAKKACNESWPIIYRTGVGETCYQLSDVWNSCSQANISLNSAESAKSDVMFYSDMRQHSDEAYYSEEVKQHLINALQQGDELAVQQVLKMLEHENFQRRLLAPNTAKALFAEIRATFSECALPLKNPEIDRFVALINFLDNATQSFKLLGQINKHVCAILKNRSHKEHQLASDLKAYIDETYMLQQLNLATAAAHFHFSEGYFSTLFKESIGQSFTEYLEGIRIYKSAVLLKETDLTIERVANLCGYNSVQSFRRAFKRVTNMHPSSLRD